MSTTEDAITHALEATETAIEKIREGDIARRETCLDVREAQLSAQEKMEKLREMIDELEQKAETERVANTKWMEKRMEQAQGMVQRILNSSLLAKDVEILEKKVANLQDSVININKAYQHYEKEFDMVDLKDQVDEMCMRIDHQEKEFLDEFPIDEQSIEQAFRGAIEALYSVQSDNPQLLEFAKNLASQMTVFRDAAANKNFHALVAPNTGKLSIRSTATPSSSSSECPISSEFSSSTLTSSYDSHPSDAASSASSSLFLKSD